MYAISVSAANYSVVFYAYSTLASNLVRIPAHAYFSTLNVIDISLVDLAFSLMDDKTCTYKLIDFTQTVSFP